MANGSKKEEKQSEIEKRIAAKRGSGDKKEKAVFVCTLDNERFERFGHLARWMREVHGISTLKFAENQYHENQALKAKIAELEKQ